MQLRLVSHIPDAATIGSYDWQTDSLTHSDCLTGLAPYLAVLMGPDETIHVAVLRGSLYFGGNFKGGVRLLRWQFQEGVRSLGICLSGQEITQVAAP